MLSRWLILMFVLSLSGCASMGTQTIPRDRFDYNTAIADSWKEQTLLNIVKIRYADMPLFVEVASVVNGYTLESSVNLSGRFPTNTSDDDVLSLGGSGKYTDRPTITYTPITGQQFNRSFLTPIPPRAVLFLMQSGWPADLILPLTVDSLNGKRATISAGASRRPGDPEFYQVTQILTRLQREGSLGMHIIKENGGNDATVMFLYRQGMSDKSREQLKQLEKLLQLQLESEEIEIRYGLFPTDKQEIAMLTRSLLQIMIAMAIQIDVPEEDIISGRTVGKARNGDTVPQEAKLIDIKTSDTVPEHAFTSIRYRDRWFWIDDRDFASKRSFTFLMILFSLMETGGREDLPLVTIPAG